MLKHDNTPAAPISLIEYRFLALQLAALEVRYPNEVRRAREYANRTGFTGDVQTVLAVARRFSGESPLGEL
jgi:hypothetical protein